MAAFASAQTLLDTAVNFTVKDVNGVTHRLNEYLEQDKMVVIDFFTITCGPCSTYAPMINESYRHFGCNSSNVVFLGINWGADNAGVADFGITNGVYYPEISGTEGNGNHVVADYGILSYPTVVLIMPDSRIAEKYIWPPTTAHLDSILVANGGIAFECTTPISTFNDNKTGYNRIVSVFPMPAQSAVTCISKVTAMSTLEVCSLAGCTVIKRIPVFPGESNCISSEDLADGYYLLLLRNQNGIILDRKPFIVLKQ